MTIGELVRLDPGHFAMKPQASACNSGAPPAFGFLAVACLDIGLCLDAPSLNLAEFFAIGNEIDALLFPWKVDLSVLQKIDNLALVEYIRRVGVPFDDCTA